MLEDRKKKNNIYNMYKNNIGAVSKLDHTFPLFLYYRRNF